MQTPSHIRTMSIGDVLDAAFRLFRERFLTLIGIAALLQVPAAILQVAVQLPFTGALVELANLTPVPGQDPLAAIPWAELGLFYALLIGISLLQTLLLTNLIGGAVISLAVAGGQGRALGILEAYREGARSLGPLALAALLTSLAAGAAVALISACVVGVGVAGLAAVGGQLDPLWGALAGGLLVILALLLVLPLVLFFSTRLLLTVPSVVVERLGPIAGLRRSWRLTGMGFWRALLMLFLLGILAYLTTTIPAQMASFAATLAFGDDGAGLVISTAVSSVLSYLGLILVQPLQFLVQLFLYYDLRVRYEGYDLELRAQGIAAGQ